MAHRGSGGKSARRAFDALPATAKQLYMVLSEAGPKSRSVLSGWLRLGQGAINQAMRQLLRSHLVRAAKRRDRRFGLRWEVQYRTLAAV